MAIKMNIRVNADVKYLTPYGEITTGSQNVTFTNVYVKIVEVKGDKEDVRLTVEFRFPDNPLRKFYRFTPSVAEDSANFIKQGYQYLKTLPEFAGAADC